MSERLAHLLTRHEGGEELTREERDELNTLLVAERVIRLDNRFDPEEVAEWLHPFAVEMVREEDPYCSRGAGGQSYYEGKIAFAHRVLSEIALLPTAEEDRP